MNSSLFVLHSSLKFFLLALSILSFFFIFEHREVALVAAGRDIVVFHSLEHSTTRLVSVSAVVEAAMLREMEYLFEIARYLFRLHIEGAEAFYARSVDDIATTWQQEHFAECCGVHTRIVSIANLGSTLLSARHNAVDKSRLTHSTISAKQSHFALQVRHYRLYTLASFCRYLQTFVADGGIKVHHHLLISSLIFC